MLRNLKRLFRAWHSLCSIDIRSILIAKIYQYLLRVNSWPSAAVKFSIETKDDRANEIPFFLRGKEKLSLPLLKLLFSPPL